LLNICKKSKFTNIRQLSGWRYNMGGRVGVHYDCLGVLGWLVFNWDCCSVGSNSCIKGCFRDGGGAAFLEGEDSSQLEEEHVLEDEMSVSLV
jgi:hypothetical protein